MKLICIYSKVLGKHNADQNVQCQYKNSAAKNVDVEFVFNLSLDPGSY